MFDIILCSQDENLINVWKEDFKNLCFVRTYHGSIFDLKADAYVSPGNSFGFMDGGLDKKLTSFFGTIVQKRLQTWINNNRAYNHELLVGEAVAIPTDHKDVPYVICAPTMRVPMILKESVNVYLATNAIIEVTLVNNFQSIVIPGLGVGVGKVPHHICSKQMYYGIVNATHITSCTPETFIEAMDFHQFLYSDSPTFNPGAIIPKGKDLQKEV